MRTTHFIQSILALLLSTGLGGIPTAHAAQNPAGPATAASPLIVAAAGQAGTGPSIAKTNAQQPARGSQGRVLFILASSKVHGTSTLPASISFGES